MIYDKLKSNFNFFCFLVTFVIYIPILFYPMSGDLSIFVSGGHALLSGKKLYIDFIDIKSPFIFYLFSLINIVFGESEFAPRLFDFISKLVLSISFIYIIPKLFTNKYLGGIASIIYSTLYMALNFTQTLQCETISSLIFLWIYYLHFYRNNILKSILTGLLLGFAIALKFTFAIVLLTLFFDFLFNIRNQNTSKKFLILLSSTILVLILIHKDILLNKEIADGFYLSIEFLRNYTNIVPYSYNLFIYFIKETISIFAGQFGMIFIISVLWSIYIIKFKKLTSEIDNRIFNFILLNFSLLLGSVFIEKKLFTYHYSRIFIDYSILSAIGLHYLIINLKFSEKINSNHLKKIIVYCSIIISIFLFPIQKVSISWKILITYFQSENRYNQLFEINSDPSLLRIQQKQIADYLNLNANIEDKLLLINTGSHQMRYFLNNKNQSVFAQSCFYLSSFAPEEWKNKFLLELMESKFIVLHNRDIHTDVFGNNLSSESNLLLNDFYNSEIKKYEIVFNTINYKVLRRTL